MLPSVLRRLRQGIGVEARRYATSNTGLGIGGCVPKKGDKVVVGMSGGVDSSVTAKLLAGQDYDLSAVFMRNWDTRDEHASDRGCEWERDWEDVQRVCKTLDIPCQMIDLSRDYWNRVFEPSLRQWEIGVTPNPDVWCNKEIKFGALLERLPVSTSHTKSWFATGHYAQKRWSSSPSSASNPRPQLIRGSDRIKDQTFYLASISEASLRRVLFPIGHLPKSEVRELARKFQLPTAERQESMGLCFVGEKGKFSRFLSSYIPPEPGPIKYLATGKTVGKHNGLWEYTIGEKIRMGGLPEKLYVTKKDIQTKTIWVVPGTDNPSLYSSQLLLIDTSWIWANDPPTGLDEPQGFKARIKIRHKMEDVGCTLRRSSSSDKFNSRNDHALSPPSHISPPLPTDDTASGRIVVEFDEPQKAAAPGQVAVLYDGDWCLGCGIIASTD